MPRPAIDLRGQVFGKLRPHTPTNKRTKRGHVIWQCACSCGGATEASSGDLKKGTVRSCGCLYGQDKITHGHLQRKKETREYRAWRGMIERCENRRGPAYRNYGARGIRVCVRWRRSFTTFLQDMGTHPGPGYSVERKNNNGNYSPSNCVWADRATQALNRRNVAKLTIGGVTKTIVEWSRQSGTAVRTIKVRRMLGRTPRQAVFDPLGIRRR